MCYFNIKFVHVLIFIVCMYEPHSTPLLDLQPHHPDYCVACVKSQRLKNLKGAKFATAFSLIP